MMEAVSCSASILKLIHVQPKMYGTLKYYVKDIVEVL